jgi:hypothetical protein
VPGLDVLDDSNQALRAMDDLLVDADTTGVVQQAACFAAALLPGLEVDVFRFDAASTYFERDGEDEPAQSRDDDGGESLRGFGHSTVHIAGTCRRS